ncbi:MAG: glycosyltransferase family 2 protein [Acidobacteriota bacterium]
MSPDILISIVTHNDAGVLALCLESLGKLLTPVRVKVWDNASNDGTQKIAEDLRVDVTVSGENLGYCGGHNRNLSGEKFDYVFFMNADVVLPPEYFARILPVFERFPRAGMATGKLQRMDHQGIPVERDGRPVLDSTGIVFYRNLRHFDRGSNETDLGQYDNSEPVFGGTGAALLCSSRFVEDLKCDGEFWDEDFFAYREDADLAWRAQLLGWQTIYEPSARAMHLRHVLPDRRNSLSPLIKMHSVKNRFLMRAKNMDWNLWMFCFPSIFIRDTGILVYILFKERSSLEAFSLLWKNRKQTKRKRLDIQSRRKVFGEGISRWFM